MDSGKGYVIDGSTSTPLLLDGSLKYPEDTPRSDIQKQQDPWVSGDSISLTKSDWVLHNIKDSWRIIAIAAFPTSVMFIQYYFMK